MRSQLLAAALVLAAASPALAQSNVFQFDITVAPNVTGTATPTIPSATYGTVASISAWCFIASADGAPVPGAILVLTGAQGEFRLALPMLRDFTASAMTEFTLNYSPPLYQVRGGVAVGALVETVSSGAGQCRISLAGRFQ